MIKPSQVRVTALTWLWPCLANPYAGYDTNVWWDELRSKVKIKVTKLIETIHMLRCNYTTAATIINQSLSLHPVAFNACSLSPLSLSCSCRNIWVSLSLMLLDYWRRGELFLEAGGLDTCRLQSGQRQVKSDRERGSDLRPLQVEGLGVVTEQHHVLLQVAHAAVLMIPHSLLWGGRKTTQSTGRFDSSAHCLFDYTAKTPHFTKKIWFSSTWNT